MWGGISKAALSYNIVRHSLTLFEFFFFFVVVCNSPLELRKLRFSFLGCVPFSSNACDPVAGEINAKSNITEKMN